MSLTDALRAKLEPELAELREERARLVARLREIDAALRTFGEADDRRPAANERDDTLLERVVALLRERPCLRRSDIAEAVGTTAKKLNSCLSNNVRNGRLFVDGPRGARRYSLKDPTS